MCLLQQKAVITPASTPTISQATKRLTDAMNRNTAYKTEVAEKGTEKQLIQAAVAMSKVKGQELLLAAQQESRPTTAAPATNKYTAVFQRRTRPATADSVLQPSARPISQQKHTSATTTHSDSATSVATPRPPAGMRFRAVSSAGSVRAGGIRVNSAPTAPSGVWGRGQPLPQIPAAQHPRRHFRDHDTVTSAPPPSSSSAATSQRSRVIQKPNLPTSAFNQANKRVGPIRSNTMSSS